LRSLAYEPLSAPLRYVFATTPDAAFRGAPSILKRQQALLEFGAGEATTILNRNSLSRKAYKCSGGRDSGHRRSGSEALLCANGNTGAMV